MAEFRPLSPFSEHFETHHPSAGSGVTVLDRDGLGLAAVQCRTGQRSALQEKMRVEFSAALPAGSRYAKYGDIAFIGTGPSSWLAVSEREKNNLAISLIDKLESLASVTDQSDAYAILRLTGPRVRDTLAKGISIDLHDRIFGPGMAASTTLSHVAIILWRLEDDADGLAVFEIAVFRSLASSLWHFLSHSAAEFGLQVTS